LVSAAEAGEKVGSLKASTAGVPADAVLRLGSGLAEQLISVRERSGLPIRIHDMYQKDEEEVLETVCRLCRESNRPLIVTAKNNEQLCEELIAARQRGKRVVILVSDLDPSARDVFIGIDNRMAGQTAALLIGRLIGGRPCKVGVIVGDYAFRCHEDREIGFRAYLRTAFPEVVLADVARGEDSPQQTRRATLDLFAVHPEIAVYNVAGGNLGLASALEEIGHANDVIVVTHEANRTLSLSSRRILKTIELEENSPDTISKVIHCRGRRATAKPSSSAAPAVNNFAESAPELAKNLPLANDGLVRKAPRPTRSSLPNPSRVQGTRGRCQVGNCRAHVLLNEVSLQCSSHQTCESLEANRAASRSPATVSAPSWCIFTS
jgi:Periplasmic binding protein domain